MLLPAQVLMHKAAGVCARLLMFADSEYVNSQAFADIFVAALAKVETARRLCKYEDDRLFAALSIKEIIASLQGQPVRQFSTHGNAHASYQHARHDRTDFILCISAAGIWCS